VTKDNNSTCDNGRLARVCRHTETFEKQNLERDRILPEMIDHIVIKLNTVSDSGSDCDSSENYNEYSNIMPNEASDSHCRVGSECLG
jgi:hypothetical protein